jgi:AcrR family transcriptional regulator
MSRQEEISAESRARLLQAAWELIAENGARKTTVQAIAERARISRGSIGWHFGSKEGLVVAVVDEAFGWLVEQVGAALDQPGPADWERIFHVQASLMADERFPIFATIGIEALLEEGEVLKAFAMGQERVRRLYATYLGENELLSAGVDPMVVAGAIRALTLGLNIQHRFDDSVMSFREALTALREVPITPVPELWRDGASAASDLDAEGA